jgi:hypothetical protein
VGSGGLCLGATKRQVDVPYRASHIGLDRASSSKAGGIGGVPRVFMLIAFNMRHRQKARSELLRVRPPYELGSGGVKKSRAPQNKLYGRVRVLE